jgi:hypothetical protein
MTIHEILIAAKALIPDEEHWWRGSHISGPRWDDCCCPVIAMHEASGAATDAWMRACDLFDEIIGGRAASWNDDPSRTFAEVHAAFDRAIEATRPRAQS